MGDKSKGRRIFATRRMTMQPYDMDGPLQPEMSYARLSHAPGTHHCTRTVTGCLLLGLDWDPPGPR